MFIDEGSIENKERDKEPWDKTVRVTTAGAMFNESNSIEIIENTLDTKLLDKDQRRFIDLVYDKNNPNKTPCVFIRRNVPFVVSAASIDNGTDRVQSTEDKNEKKIDFGIVKEDKNGNKTRIDRQDGAYLFRVANYPRASYEDQPEYYFEAFSEDLEGNQTIIKLPLYVINSNASFETSAK